jgi:hypothetical protein
MKLDSELQMEKEMKQKEGSPMSVKDYLSNGPFEIIDTPGQEDVVLTRQFGDEKYDNNQVYWFDADSYIESKSHSQLQISTTLRTRAITLTRPWGMR